MRLICPKCNAQYDIASDAIPKGGRDVQCSSCSHTWFQTEKSPEAASVVASAEQSDIVTPKVQSPVVTEVENAITKRKPLDSSIADILRQEAAREKANAEANAVSEEEPTTETPAQPQQIRNEPVTPEETRRRISMMTDEEEINAPAAVAATGAVSDDTNLRTVPTIDEINEELRTRSQPENTGDLTDTEQSEVVQRRGFRRGFAFVLILIALAITPYIFADQIVAKFPKYAETIDAYIEIMDNLRLWLNERFQNVSGMSEQYTGSSEPSAPAPAVESTAPLAPTAPSE